MTTYMRPSNAGVQICGAGGRKNLPRSTHPSPGALLKPDVLARSPVTGSIVRCCAVPFAAAPPAKAPSADAQIQGQPAGQCPERPADPCRPQNCDDCHYGEYQRAGEQRGTGYI